MKTRQINVGNVKIGGNAPVVIQSMTNTDTKDIKATLEQIEELYKAGCQIVRCAVVDNEAVSALSKICEKSPIPVVADIHFDYKLAINSISAGVQKVRINPGNIGSEERVKKVVSHAKLKKIPIRIGVNSGSVEKEILKKYGSPTPEALVESAMYHASLLEKFDFDDICLSMKSSSVKDTIRAYQIASEKTNYPLHIGVTEAGTEYMGTIKSAIGIGGLLALGIGDTIRVSLTDSPVKEIYAAHAILKAVGLNDNGVQIISCPTCGRTKIDLINIAKEVEDKTAKIKGKKLKIAVMGCAVNGPGEAKEADIGIAGGDGKGIIFKKGEIIKTVRQENLVDALMNEINSL